MADSRKKISLMETWLSSLKNRPTVAALLLLATLITGAASFVESVDKLLQHFDTKSDSVTQSEQDIYLTQAIIGTWRSSSKLPVPSGFIVKDFRYTFLPNDTVNWRGSYSYQGHEIPIMMSGKWNIVNSLLNYKIESSNIPLVIKEGFTSATKIVHIANDKMTYIDSADGNTKTDYRIE